MSTDDKKEILDAIGHLGNRLEKSLNFRIDEVIESIHVFSTEMDRQFIQVHKELDELRSDLTTTKHTGVHHREMDMLVDKLETKNVLTPKDVREIRAAGVLS